MANEPGRPGPTDEEYKTWLENMRPFLENNCSLYYAIVQAGLLHQKDSIYRKYRVKDWFSEKIDLFRRTPGEIVNESIVNLVRNINDKVKRKELITKDEQDILKFYAQYGRPSQPFFVNRVETAQVDPIDELLDELDKEDEKSDTIDDVAEQAKKQVVETNPPLQDQEQTGPASPVQAEPDATSTQS